MENLKEKATDMVKLLEETKRKYVIFRNEDYYPHVVGVYETIEEARKEYNWYIVEGYSNIFLCSIIAEKQEI